MYCPKCGADLGSDYVFNAAFDAYNFSCKKCKLKFFVLYSEVNNG